MNDYSMVGSVVSVTGPDGKELRVSREAYEADKDRWGDLWEEPSSPIVKATGKSVTGKSGKAKPPADPDRVVTLVQEDGRYFVADGDGEKLDEPESFAADGYASDIEAWAAVSAAKGK